MTLADAKKEVFLLLDETKPKPEFKAKLNTFFDRGQKEISLYYPIWKSKEYGKDDARVFPTDCYRPTVVITNGNRLPFRSMPSGAFTLCYEALPETITDESPDSIQLSISGEAAYALVLYVAAQCNATEHDQRFFNSFYSQYQGKLGNLLNSSATPVAVVVKGGEVCSEL